jgi:ABC-type antimicrobial peptide transport system permease subunit
MTMDQKLSSLNNNTSYSISALTSIALTNLLNRKIRSIIIIAGITLSITLLANILLLFEIQNFSSESERIVLLKEYQFWLAVISLLIGMISIGNSVLISLFERIHEIGTLRTSGCSSLQILYLFSSELIILSIIGGMLSSITGFLSIFLLSFPEETLDEIITTLSNNLLEIIPFLLLVLILISIFLTFISSIPALIRGSRYRIIEALTFRI